MNRFSVLASPAEDPADEPDEEVAPAGEASAGLFAGPTSSGLGLSTLSQGSLLAGPVRPSQAQDSCTFLPSDKDDGNAAPVMISSVDSESIDTPEVDISDPFALFGPIRPPSDRLPAAVSTEDRAKGTLTPASSVPLVNQFNNLLLDDGDPSLRRSASAPARSRHDSLVSAPGTAFESVLESPRSPLSVAAASPKSPLSVGAASDRSPAASVGEWISSGSDEDADDVIIRSPPDSPRGTLARRLFGGSPPRGSPGLVSSPSDTSVSSMATQDEEVDQNWTVARRRPTRSLMSIERVIGRTRPPVLLPYMPTEREAMLYASKRKVARILEQVKHAIEEHRERLLDETDEAAEAVKLHYATATHRLVSDGMHPSSHWLPSLARQHNMDEQEIEAELRARPPFASLFDDVDTSRLYYRVLCACLSTYPALPTDRLQASKLHSYAEMHERFGAASLDAKIEHIEKMLHYVPKMALIEGPAPTTAVASSTTERAVVVRKRPSLHRNTPSGHFMREDALASFLLHRVYADPRQIDRRVSDLVNFMSLEGLDAEHQDAQEVLRTISDACWDKLEPDRIWRFWHHPCFFDVKERLMLICTVSEHFGGHKPPIEGQMFWSSLARKTRPLCHGQDGWASRLPKRLRKEALDPAAGLRFDGGRYYKTSIKDACRFVRNNKAHFDAEHLDEVKSFPHGFSAALDRALPGLVWNVYSTLVELGLPTHEDWKHQFREFFGDKVYL